MSAKHIIDWESVFSPYALEVKAMIDNIRVEGKEIEAICLPVVPRFESFSDEHPRGEYYFFNYPVWYGSQIAIILK